MAIRVATGKAKCTHCDRRIDRGEGCVHLPVNSRAAPYICKDCVSQWYRLLNGETVLLTYAVWEVNGCLLAAIPAQLVRDAGVKLLRQYEGDVGGVSLDDVRRLLPDPANWFRPISCWENAEEEIAKDWGLDKSRCRREIFNKGFGLTKRVEYSLEVDRDEESEEIAGLG